MFSTVEKFMDFLDENGEVVVILGSGKDYECAPDYTYVVDYDDETVATMVQSIEHANVQFPVTAIEHVYISR